jgi:hypothetical protein
MATTFSKVPKKIITFDANWVLTRDFIFENHLQHIQGSIPSYLPFLDFLVQVIVFCKDDHAYLKNTSCQDKPCHLPWHIEKLMTLYVQNKPMPKACEGPILCTWNHILNKVIPRSMAKFYLHLSHEQRFISKIKLY